MGCICFRGKQQHNCIFFTGGTLMFSTAGAGTKKEPAEGIRLTTTVHGEKTLMGRFEMRKGARIPVHSHHHEQTGVMISGKLRFVVDGETRDVETGDSWCFKGGVEHSAEALEDSIVIEVFSPLREDYL